MHGACFKIIVKDLFYARQNYQEPISQKPTYVLLLRNKTWRIRSSRYYHGVVLEVSNFMELCAVFLWESNSRGLDETTSLFGQG